MSLSNANFDVFTSPATVFLVMCDPSMNEL